MFWRLRQAFASFMYGRYGVDTIYWILLVSALIISVASRITGSGILYVLQSILLFVALFRFFSRNIYKRRRENDAVKLFLARFRDIGKKRYRKCNACKATLRLPIKRGKNTVRCPKCGNSFKVIIII